MKQLVFMLLFTGLGVAGSFYRPFFGVLVYYFFAVLRPQALWQWTLPPDLQWSRYVALAALVSLLMVGPNGLSGKRTRQPPLNCAHLLFALNFIWLFVCYLTAQHRDVSSVYWMEYIKIFLMIAVASLSIRTVTDAWAIMIVASVAISYIAYEVNALYLLTGYMGIARNGYGGLDNNGAALMLAMGVPLCLAAWDTIRGPSRWLFMAQIPILIHAVLMTFSRGAMLSLIITGPLLYIHSRRRAQLSILAIIIIVTALPVMVGPEIRDRFLSIGAHEIDESANSRKMSWAAAWRIGLDYPLTGVGIRNANLFSYQYGADMEGRTIHNNYLQILADTGFPGLGLYVIMLVLCWMYTRCVRCKSILHLDEDSRRLSGIAYGVEGSMSVFCVGAVFLSLENFELPFLLLFLSAQTLSLISLDEHGTASKEA